MMSLSIWPWEKDKEKTESGIKEGKTVSQDRVGTFWTSSSRTLTKTVGFYWWMEEGYCLRSLRFSPWHFPFTVKNLSPCPWTLPRFFPGQWNQGTHSEVSHWVQRTSENPCLPSSGWGWRFLIFYSVVPIPILFPLPDESLPDTKA